MPSRKFKTIVSKVRDVVFYPRSFILFDIAVIYFGIFTLEQIVERGSSQKVFLSFFFEGKTSYIFAALSFLPSVVSYCFIMFNEKNYNFGKFLFPLLGMALIFFSYFSSKPQRRLISKIYSFGVAPSGLEDWLGIPNFISCKVGSGCDPFGRPQVVGYLWKIFRLLGNLTFSVAVLSICVGYIFLEVYKFAQFCKIPLFAFAITFSPSLVFALERGNPDLFVFGLCLLGIRFVPNNLFYNSVFSAFLASLKPFFLGFFLRDIRNQFGRLLVVIPLVSFCYIWSMSFDFNKISLARRFTIYQPSSQIGLDQIPSFLIQFALNHLRAMDRPWSAKVSIFIASEFLGIFFLFMVVYFLQKSIFSKTIFLSISRLPRFYKDLTWICISIYTITYLSGSQVVYKTWMLFPLLLLVVKESKFEIVTRSKFSLLIITMIFFGTLGINVWMIRGIATFITCSFCLALIVHKFSRKGNL